ncbi:MAG: ABC transporter permease [Thermomicrobiales bacterium]|nr:ABC transporter permease [Thermomicrobiales bacterium]
MVTLIGVIVAVFVITRVLPGDPVAVKAGQRATPEVRAAITKELGLDRPLPIQLIDYIVNVFRGDLGESTRSGQPVLSDLTSRLPATIELGLASLLLAAGVGIPLGIVAALRRGTKIDAAIQQVTILGAAVPTFWFGLVLIYLLYHVWQIAPPPVGRLSTGIAAPPPMTRLYTVDALLAGDWQAFRNAVAHLALPAFALGFTVMSPFIKITRSAMLDIMRSEYVLAARSLGFSDPEIVWQDAVKNTLVSVLTVAGIVLGYLLAGNVLIETIFSWPGVGFYAWNALTGSDYDAIQGFVLVVAIIYVGLNLAIDVAYSLIDPRIRLG